MYRNAQFLGHSALRTPQHLFCRWSRLLAFGVGFHGCSDGSLIYVTFAPGQDEDSAHDSILNCVPSVKSWTTQNWLKVNGDKVNLLSLFNLGIKLFQNEYIHTLGHSFQVNVVRVVHQKQQYYIRLSVRKLIVQEVSLGIHFFSKYFMECKTNKYQMLTNNYFHAKIVLKIKNLYDYAARDIEQITCSVVLTQHALYQSI